VETWQVIGTVAAIVFGTIGATVTVTKLVWDRRDRQTALAKEDEEASRLAHERERRRREGAQWEAADQEEQDREFRVYSEAEARQFLSEYPLPAGTPKFATRGRAILWLFGALIIAIAGGITYWLLSR
jgi:hypothetical protein